jgi:hypothetical protein
MTYDPATGDGIIDTETDGLDTFLTLDDVRIAKRVDNQWQPILPGYTIRETDEHLIITSPRSPAR